MVVSSRAKIGPSTTVLMTERAPHVSDIRNQVSSISVDVKEESKGKKERVNAYNIKQRTTPQTVTCPASSIQERGEPELSMALQVSTLLTTLYRVYTLLHGICCHEHRIFALMSVGKVHVGTLGTWELEVKVHTYIHTCIHIYIHVAS